MSPRTMGWSSLLHPCPDDGGSPALESATPGFESQLSQDVVETSKAVLYSWSPSYFCLNIFPKVTKARVGPTVLSCHLSSSCLPRSIPKQCSLHSFLVQGSTLCFHAMSPTVTCRDSHSIITHCPMQCPHSVFPRMVPLLTYLQMNNHFLS